MKNYLNNLVNEKGLDRDFTFEVEGQNMGINFISLQVVLEHILISTPQIQKQIKDTLVKIDFPKWRCNAFFQLFS